MQSWGMLVTCRILFFFFFFFLLFTRYDIYKKAYVGVVLNTIKKI